MRRRLLLEPVKHKPPASAKKRDDGLFDLSFDLRNVFHHGFIEVHDLPPKAGKNPFFDEYSDFLAEDTDLLKWSRRIARGDHKSGESQKLGRIFARAYLSLHGYRWFPDIRDLLRRPERGWSVRRPASGGNMPDWLIGDGKKFAVAEAKGTHSAIDVNSKVLARLWRPQLANVEVFKDAARVTLKGWIIATRWVTSKQKETDPKMYAEDPETPGDVALDHNDEPEVNTWLARVHTLRNLHRIGRHHVAQRVAAIGSLRQGVPVASPVTWRCAAPGLENIPFLGRPIGTLPPMMPWGSMEWRLLREFLPISGLREDWERWTRIWSATIDDGFEDMWFDGLALPTVTALVADHNPPNLEQGEDVEGRRPDVSLLPDGSLLAPMSLMKPDGRTDV